MILDKNLKIGIIGLGLMGGGYAMALSEKGYDVGAVDTDPGAIRYALEKGLISHGRSEIDPGYISSFDLVIFALYPKTFIKWITENQKYFKPHAVITDVTGIKKPVVYEVQNILRPDLEYIGAHPMAGRESSGVENAKKEIFLDANYIITPTDKNTPEAISLCTALGSTLGFKQICTLTPEKHDEMIGFLSHLTHCIAISLMTCRDTEGLEAYSGDSFRDLTRIAKINETMWSELFLSNKQELIKQMDDFSEAFKRLRGYIENDDREKIKELMKLSTKQRILFDK